MAAACSSITCSVSPPSSLAARSSSLSPGYSPSPLRRPINRHPHTSVSYSMHHTVKIAHHSRIRASTEASTTTSDTDARAGVAVYKPSSYEALISDAAKSLCYALDENKRRLEIEFPPLPSSTSGYKSSSDEFIDANMQLVLALVRKLFQMRGVSSRIVFPDKTEKRRAMRVFKSTLEMIDGVSLGSLEDIPGGGSTGFLQSLQSVFDFDFGGEEEGTWQNGSNPSLYFFVGCSSGELPTVEKYVNSFAAEFPAVLFNLELDTLRADLGLFGFPNKEVHYRFLSQFFPVYYIRTRDYSKTIAAAPFVVDYTGALFRMYPGPWQVMLKQGDGSYVCVAESSDRFTLGQTKEELLVALGLQEVKGTAMAFLRQGYKNSTWWEDNVEAEGSAEWRS